MKKGIEIQKTYIGIDVSKLSIDVSLITPEGDHAYRQFGNTLKEFKEMVPPLALAWCYNTLPPYSLVLFVRMSAIIL